MKRLVLIVALLVFPILASADPGNGIDMQWQDCVGGPSDVSDRFFNCTGNSTHTLNLNFKINQDLPGFVTFTAFIDAENATPGPLAPFWHYESGGCQRLGGTSPDGVTTSDAIPTTAYCVDNFSDIVNGDPVATIMAYVANVPSPGRGRFIVQVASGPVIPIHAGDNKFAMSLIFNTRNRAGGPGANCAGCGQQMALTWTHATLESNDGADPFNLYSGDKGSTCATIQGGFNPCSTTPVRAVTWGRLKSLYH